MKITKFLVLIMVCMLALNLVSCGNSAKKQQEIIDTFASFENSDNYVFKTDSEIHIGGKIINIDDIKYNGEPCYIISCGEKGAYGYSYSDDSQTNINILYVEYENASVTLLNTLSLPEKIIMAEYYDNELYFRMNDNETEEFNQIYFIYNIDNGTTESIDTDDIPLDIERLADHGSSADYTIEPYNDSIVQGLISGNRLKITNNKTGESKILSNDLLNTCEEGKKILGFGENNLGGFTSAYEKDGVIYVENAYITDGFLGDIYHCFIMKYYFESHTLEYYTSVLFEEYPASIDSLYIP